MSNTAGAKATAHDASAALADNQPPRRPPNQAELDYFEAREQDLLRAIDKADGQIDGLRQSRKQFAAELAEVRRERKAATS